MSCITQLLELKGEKDYLHIHDQVVIEGGGIYEGYEYLIVFTDHGHRCGYVAIPDGVGYDVDAIHCHGGITFEERDHSAKNLLPIPCNDMWIGFDAAHCDDHHNYETAQKYFNRPQEHYDFMNEVHKELFKFEGITHKSYDFMECQCKYIIDQIQGRYDEHRIRNN